jgi:4-amino-4-deoxy-L-arabinose transferase-like glycosyltransferase
MLKRLPFFLKLLFSWYCFVYLSIIVLSWLHLLQREFVLVGNLLFLLAMVFVYRKRLVLRKSLFQKVNFITILISSLLTLTFIQGFFSAPSTTDSMVYHLTRMMYWVQEKTVFQSVIRNPHDFMPPFAEYLFLHLYLLVGSDRLLFLSQWLAYAGLILLSGQITVLLGATPKLRWTTILLVATLPIALLEATSTQTDMVATFLVLLLLQITLLCQKKLRMIDGVVIGVVVGLGMLVKPSTAIFMLIPLGNLVIANRKKMLKMVFFGLIAISTFVALQWPYYTQNKRLFGNFLGEKVTNGNSIYTNTQFSFSITLSNVIRNILINIPVPIWNNQANQVVEGFYQILKISTNDPRNTFPDTYFSVQKMLYPQEDIVANPIHILIVFSTLSLFFVRRKAGKMDVDVKNIFFLSILSLTIFSVLLKWQPFHSRLLMPFYIIGTIVGAIALSKTLAGGKLLSTLVCTSFILSVTILLLNVAHPYVSYTKISKFVEPYRPANLEYPEAFYIRPRDRQYFNARPYWYRPYTQIVANMKFASKDDTIVFKLMDGFEYPLWILLKINDVRGMVVPISQIDSANIIVTTDKNIVSYDNFETSCVRTEIDYGYACLSVKKI